MRWAFRMLLGREPESDTAIEAHLRCGSIAGLRQQILGSEEYAAQHHGHAALTMDGSEAPMVIDTEASTEDMQRLVDHIRDVWQRLGETEPHWSVFSVDQFKSENLSPEDFYETGRDPVHRVVATLERNGIDPRRLRTCLEYGCGVGRMTAWFAKQFELVHGVDISQPHLDLAESRLNQAGAENFQLHRLRELTDIDSLPEVDFVFTAIVLQHNPPPVIVETIRQLLGRLTAGGVMIFQVPTYRQGYHFRITDYLADQVAADLADKEMEMHVVPQRKIFELVDQTGCRVLEVLEDAWAGMVPKELSSTFVIQKTGSPQ